MRPPLPGRPPHDRHRGTGPGPPPAPPPPGPAAPLRSAGGGRRCLRRAELAPRGLGDRPVEPGGGCHPPPVGAGAVWGKDLAPGLEHPGRAPGLSHQGRRGLSLPPVRPARGGALGLHPGDHRGPGRPGAGLLRPAAPGGGGLRLSGGGDRSEQGGPGPAAGRCDRAHAPP